MSVIHGANYGTPTLDLNFAENKSLIDTISGQNFVTFSRSQTRKEATYVGSDGLIKYASADEPRFDHNPVTGESLGLLVEESRTNLITYSDDFSNASWSKNEVILTPNVGISPDGTFTATKISSTTVSTDEHILVHTTSAGSSVQSIWSVYAKAGENTKIGLRRNANDGLDLGQVDLTTGELLRAVPGYTTTVQTAGNGWWKISLSFSSTSAANLRPCICPIPNSLPTTADADTFYSGDGVSGIYIWGAQLEAGSFPTSYIPTTGSQVIRSADEASITGTNFSRWYNQSEGTLYSIGRFNQLTSFAFQVETDSFGLSLGKDNGNFFRFRALQFSNLSDTSKDFTTNLVKLAVAGTINNAASAFNGVISATSTSIPSITIQPTALSIGARIDGSGRYSGTISRLTYYPTRLQNYQLQQLTK